MKARAVFFWVLAALTYAAYGVLFGSIRVEGYEAPPLSAVVLDVVTGALSVLFFAFLLALVGALIPRKHTRYIQRLGRLVPVMAFLLALVLLVGMALVEDRGPVAW